MAEKLEALSRFKNVEHIMRALQMKLLHDKVCISESQKILPFSTSWWRSCEWPEPGSEQPITATWLADSVELSPFSARCPRGQEAVEGAHDALDVRGGEVQQD